MGPVYPLTAANWPWVGFVRSFFPALARRPLNFAVGSGFLIHPQVFLTAGHVIYDTVHYGGMVNRVDVTFPGPQTFTARDFKTTDQWIETDSATNNPLSAFDIAALFFDPPGLTKIPVVAWADGTNLSGVEVTVVGFTGEHYPSVPFYGGSSFTTPSPYDASRISYPIATRGGMSGGPVYTLSASALPTVRGVHTSILVDGSGNGLRFNQNIVNLINFWLGRGS
jgi:V8-like Glu-specific endopeptidase